MKFNLVLDNVTKGKWRSFLIINDSERDRNAGLVSLNVENNKSNNDLDFINIIKNGDWKKIGNIGVDVGMAGIYDLKYYRDDNIASYNTKYFTESKDPGYFTESKDPGEKWFDMNSNIVIKPTDFAGVIKHGTVTLSGYGDGMYNVYVLRDNKSKIIGVKIIFIEP